MSSQDFGSGTSNDDAFSPSSSKRRRLYSDGEESSSSSLPSVILVNSAYHRQNESDSESEISNYSKEHFEEGLHDAKWSNPLGNQTKISFSNSNGINTHQSEIFSYTEPHSFYSLFVTNEIFEIIASQTNKYAAGIVLEQRSHRLDRWVETNPNEIKRFFGLIMWMGIVKLPQIPLYWSRNEAFSQTFPAKVMSRNRFEILLRLIHFSDHEENDQSNSLNKITHIVNMLNESFKKYFKPDEILYVDETFSPFGGSLLRQCLKPNWRLKRVKLLKLLSCSGYTHSFQIHTGKRDKRGEDISSEMLISLCKDVLGKGHTICTDKSYTSVHLAEKLLTMNTHLVGPVRKRRRENSVEVVFKKLKRGEVIARENASGVTMLKWKDDSDLLMLSTKHSAEFVTIHKKFQSYEKPKMVEEYNQAKSSIDLSDRMTAFSSPLSKTLKWHSKLVMELLLNTCVANAMVLFKHVTCREVKIYDFRMKVAMHLAKCRDEEVRVSISPPKMMPRKPRHELKVMRGKAGRVRRFCKMCYRKNSKAFGRATAKNTSKKVVTYCQDCTGSPFLCLECFNTVHRSIHA